MRLKGPARSIDVSLLFQEQRRLRKKISGTLVGFLEDEEALYVQNFSKHVKHVCRPVSCFTFNDVFLKGSDRK